MPVMTESESGFKSTVDAFSVTDSGFTSLSFSLGINKLSSSSSGSPSTMSSTGYAFAFSCEITMWKYSSQLALRNCNASIRCALFTLKVESVSLSFGPLMTIHGRSFGSFGNSFAQVAISCWMLIV